MYRKVLIVFVSIIFDLGVMVRASFLLLISGISLHFTSNKKPFSVTDLNELELKSNLAALITIYSGMMYMNIDHELSKALFFLILMFTNMGFVFFWVKSLVVIFLSVKAQKLYDTCPGFFNQFIAISEGIINLI